MDHYRFYNLVGQQVSTLVANSPWPTPSLRQAHTTAWRHESNTHVPRGPHGQTHPKRHKTLFLLIHDFWMLSSKKQYSNMCSPMTIVGFTERDRLSTAGGSNQCTAYNGEFLTIYRKCAPVLWTTMLIGQWKYMSPIAAPIGRCQMSRPRNFWRTAQDFRFRDPNIAQPVTQTDVLSTTKWIY